MLRLINFILRFESGLPVSKQNLPWPDIFVEARKSGFSNDPYDSGGATLCGITLATFRTYCNSSKATRTATERPHSATVASLKSMSPEVWRDILKTMYWDRWQADKISDPRIARILVDWVWASGVHGIRRPQRLLGVKADGIVGPKTLNALNARIAADRQVSPAIPGNHKTFMDMLIADRLRYVDDIISRRPSQGRYRAGWRRRILSFNDMNY